MFLYVDFNFLDAKSNGEDLISNKIGLTFYMVYYVFFACLKINVVLSYGIWDEGAIILSKRLENRTKFNKILCSKIEI